MTDPKEELRGVDVPRPCPAHTPVRTGGRVELEGGVRCHAGKICAVGTIPVPDGESLAEVRAFVYHSDPNPIPDSPPAGAVSYVPSDPADNEFFFDHNPDHVEVPDVRCENGSPRDDNWLVIWALWVSKEAEDKMTAAWQFKEKVRVCGVCDTQTECQQA